MCCCYGWLILFQLLAFLQQGEDATLQFSHQGAHACMQALSPALQH
jgi:hypothetical protein